MFTNENLRFLDDQLEELKSVPPPQAIHKPIVGREEQKIDPGLIQQQAEGFLSEFGPLLDDIPNPGAGTSTSGDTPRFVEELDALFGGMIQHIQLEKRKGNPLARTLFTQYESLIEGYEGAFRKLQDYRAKSQFALPDKQEKRRRGIVKQYFSYDRPGKYKTDGKPDYRKLVRRTFYLVWEI